MTKIEREALQALSKGLHHGLFATRGTVQDAYDYVNNILGSIVHRNDMIYATTAIHVLMNSIADEIQRRIGEKIYG